MACNTNRIVAQIESSGFSVMNWKPGNRRIFKVINAIGREVSGGMYSNELRAWFDGYTQGLKTKAETES